MSHVDRMRPEEAVPDDVLEARAAPGRVFAKSIDLRQNLATKVATGLIAAVVAAVLLGLFFGRFAKTEPVRGIVAAEGGFARLDAPADGTIVTIHVKQGQAVRPGDKIYTLRLGALSSGGEPASVAQIRNLTQARERFSAQLARINRFMTDAEATQRTVRAQDAALEADLADQLKSLDKVIAENAAIVKRIEAYLKQGFATRELLEMHQKVLFDYRRQRAEVQMKATETAQLRSQHERSYAVLMSDKSAERTMTETQMTAAANEIATLRTASEVEVQAQAGGTIVAIAAKIGDSVKKGGFVVGIGDPGARPLIVISAPTRAIGLTKPGQRVILKYDSFPFKTFGIYHGTVSYISSAAINEAPTMGDGIDPRPLERQSSYRIEVRPDQDFVTAYGEQLPLKLGSTLSADIVVERRRLIDWVLDPIRALRGRG